MLELERAQRLILKISFFKPRLYPTLDLYRECGLLTVRQLYVLSAVLRQHMSIGFHKDNPSLTGRRQCAVCKVKLVNTSFAQIFFAFLGCKLYNLVNEQLLIYSRTKVECKKTVIDWLQGMRYDETEALLIVQK